jgi:hypothetical protein
MALALIVGALGDGRPLGVRGRLSLRLAAPWRLSHLPAPPVGPTPGGEVGHRDSAEPLERSLDARHRSLPIARTTEDGFSARGDRLGGAPFGDRNLPISDREFPELAQVGKHQVLCQLPATEPDRCVTPSADLRATE